MKVLGPGAPSPFPASQHQCCRAILESATINLVNYMDDISPAEIFEFQFGDHTFGLKENRGNAMIYEKFGQSIFEYPVNLMREPDSELRSSFLRRLEEGESFFYLSVLVERKTNIIKAMRMFGLSRRFNQKIQQMFFRQVSDRSTKLPIYNSSIVEVWNSLSHKELNGTK